MESLVSIKFEITFFIRSEANVPVKHLISNMFGNIANET